MAGFICGLDLVHIERSRLVGWPSSLCEIGPRKGYQDQRRLYFGGIGSLYGWWPSPQWPLQLSFMVALTWLALPGPGGHATGGLSSLN